MKLIHCRSTWGLTGSLEEKFELIQSDGYSVVETSADLGDPGQARELLKSKGLGLIQIAQTQGKTVEEHVQSFRRDTERVAAYQPRHLTVHSGADWFSAVEAVRFYKEIVRIEQDLSFPVAHETHRSRVFFNPWSTRDVLAEVPQLKLCCDFSHWVCVAERLLQDCESILDLCAQRCIHIHARVGYEEGPQVPDPSAPEYRRHLEAHEQWWRKILTARSAAGQTDITITPEYGPPAYLHTLPHTNVPVADLRQICNWMRGRVIETLK